MFYDHLNQFIDQLEQHLDTEIDYAKLAKSVGVNFATLQKVFPLIANISLADYVRKRRLTLAGKDLAQSDLRIIDVAEKYGYNSAAAFSRAFCHFHQVKPSEVKLRPKSLKYFPKLTFTAPEQVQDLQYEIISLPELNLRGLKIISDNTHISADAPQLFQTILRDYPDLPHPDYGVLVYGGGRDDDDNYQYYTLWQGNITGEYPEFVSYHIAPARWLKFHIDSQEADDIQNATNQFYESFLPTCKYKLRPEPDLEYYHDGVTDFLVPIF